jgi:murein DD-endopeptidase MepM/ murein hydrolase activator NlpD
MSRRRSCVLQRFGVVPLTLFSGGCVLASQGPSAALQGDLEARPHPQIVADRGSASDATTLEVVAAPVAPEPPPAAAEPSGPRSEALSCGLSNPMPGGFMAGYRADTGLDIAGMSLPVFAIADGVVEYAEAGHTLWTGPGDTDLAIRIRLDQPIAFGERKVTHAWYAHMGELAFEQPQTAKQRRHVKAGDYLGTNGRANGMWHLHLGLLLNGDTSQGWGSFLLEDEVRAVLCGMRAKQRLPSMPKARAALAAVGEKYR